MKLKLWLASTLMLATLVSACTTSTTPAPATGSTYVSASLDVSYENALSARNQLALGTLNLADTAVAVDAEQAAALLPLWQAVRATNQTGGASQTEVNALLAQIESTLSAEQLSAIRDQQLTQTDMQDWAQANGITLGSGSGVPGSGQGLSPEARATRQAEMGRTESGSSGGASTALIEAVIDYLTGRIS